MCITRKDPESGWLAKDNSEINLITIKLETVSHVAEKFSWVPLSCCSPSGYPFPIKAFALSARVSPQTIHFQVLDKNLLLGPGKGPPSCNTGATVLRHPWLIEEKKKVLWLQLGKQREEQPER